MAEIVLGIGTSHGPMLSTPPDQWGQRVEADKRNPQHWFKGKPYTYDQLVALRANENMADQITQKVWNERHAACRAAIAKLAQVFEEVKPDIAVVIGNDQMELFTTGTIPAMSVYWGEKIPNDFPDEMALAAMPPGIPISVPGHIPPEGATYEGLPDLGRHLIDHAIEDSFDVAAVTGLPEGGRHNIPHAFGFVYRQIMNDKPVPSVPVILNTFYPPNQPTVGRCYDLGKSLVRAIQSWDDKLRVALIASGGLSHFVVDEEVDTAVMDALKKRTIKDVAALGEPIFQAGTSECKNWVPVAGAMADLGLKPTVVDYVPCYRSMAGTGNAMGFVYWRA